MGLFKNKNTSTRSNVFDKRIASAQAFLVNSAGELMVVKSGYKDYWSVPGGIIDQGETPLVTVQREVYEEVGVNLPSADYTFIIASSRRSQKGMSYQFVFSAELGDYTTTDLTLQKSEIERAEFVTKAMIDANDRVYSPLVHAWADKKSGYLEFTSIS